ncbi:MAG: heme lyase CcmF/NrfE family subunit [Anaerolineales bacterium]|nr:heme lyase CcmF/NrfE family subunit [Anaerolineales bacterium]MDW8447705.1 heme lyase CcmF/NrfE family subunit [Anaerolineales bacterium]
MINELGYGTLAITFFLALYGIGAAIWGVQKRKPEWVESARNAMLLTFPLLTISCASMIYLLVNGNYEVEYVSSVTSNSMPLYLRITALWGGQAGSLLFWSWLMSAFASAVTLRNWQRDREFLPWVIVVSLVTLGFFLGLTLFVENPFDRLWLLPNGIAVKSFFAREGAIPFYQSDGKGLNPLLRHPGMIVHPPMLYLGFVSFVIPFAFAIAALITNRTDDRWIQITRRWSLVAWLFLSLGLILGARWAYDVLGWGGYWGWDPVEIAAFMPWLTGTAFLHSVMIQEKRGMLKHWNMILIILTYNLVIFGTFLTRSGVLSSVHSFAQSAIGPLFFVYIGASSALSLGLLLHRWQDLKTDLHMTSVLSREALFLLNNLLFMGILVICFWGVIFPLLSEIITGQKVTVGPPFYERATAPLFAALLLLMGIAPLAAWRHSTLQTLGKAVWKPTLVSLLAPLTAVLLGVRNLAALIGFWLAAFVACVTLYEYGRAAIARSRTHGESLPLAFWNLVGRNRRRYGGYIIHLGVVLMAIGILGIELFQKETQATLARGEELRLGPYTMRFESLAVFDTADGRNVARAVVSVYKNERFVGELYPRRDYYYESQQPMTIPGVRSTMEDDFYVLLVDWQPISSAGATFKVYQNPLVNWLWLGGFVFILGTLIAAWPESEKSPATARVKRQAPLGAEAS